VTAPYFPKEAQEVSWKATQDYQDWIRWIVPIEAGVLGLSVSLYKPEISLHHVHPSFLKWAWAAFALSIVCGVIGATSVASVRRGLAKAMRGADDPKKALELSREFELHVERHPPGFITACLVLCPTLFAIGLLLLVLFTIWL
jgi:hypothetical protein